MVNIGFKGPHVLHFENKFAKDAGAGPKKKALGGVIRARRPGMEFNESHSRNIGQPLENEGNDRIVRKRGNDTLHHQELSEYLHIHTRICR